MKIDWDSLTDQDFEELCYDILYSEDFVDLKWLGRGGKDRGRDITCTRAEMILGNIKKETRYLVQCKKYVARPPSPSDLNDTIAWADVHKPHVLLIMVSNTLSADTNDWLSMRQKDKSYQILVYEEKDFEHFLEKNRELFTRYFEKRKKESISEPTIAKTQNKILMCLINRSKKSIEEISKEVNKPVPETKTILNKLRSKKIVVCSKEYKTDRMITLYSLGNSLEAFIGVAKELLPTNYKFDFVSSSFSRDMINKRLCEYVEARYFLELPEDFKDGLVIIFRISPTALHESLFSDNRLYATGYHHLESLKLADEIRQKWADSYVASFTSNLLEKMLIDLRHPSSKNALQQNNIGGYKLSLGIRMANDKKPIIDLSSESVIMLMKAVGMIEAGVLVSATSPDLFISVGSVLMNLGLLEEAIKEYNLAIEQVKDDEKLKVAWNNKGVCFMRLQRISDAISCFDEALKIDPNLKEAQKNKLKCLDFTKN